MRCSSRPVSSPGRVENYPPILMRFLRTNIGSKSRGRSRSSPMFVRRKNTTPAPATETREPSSPKVTCMGQVRMTRSNKPRQEPGRVAGKRRRRRRCWWVKNVFLCHTFAGKLRTNCFSHVWRKWVSFSHFSFSRKSEKRSSSTRSEQMFKGDETETREAEEDEEEEYKANSSKSFASTTPPRNAFLLTRCRSEPYRSSSLASRFWGSPGSGEREHLEQKSLETEQVQTQQKQQEDSDEVSENVSQSVSGESSSTSVTETERLEDSVAESKTESEDRGDAKTELFGSPRRRLILTRCKSEPARTGERLVAELDLWKNTRLGFT